MTIDEKIAELRKEIGAAEEDRDSLSRLISDKTDELKEAVAEKYGLTSSTKIKDWRGRERKLVEAVMKIRSIIDDGEAHGVASWSVLSSIDHEVDCALVAYSEHPNAVFSQEVAWDSRDRSIGMTEEVTGND